MAKTTKKTDEVKTSASVKSAKEEVVVKPEVKESPTVEIKTEPVKTQPNENEMLKLELDEMKQRMAVLMQMMGSNLNSNSTTPDRDIEVISLITGNLLLTTTGQDSGQKYNFTHQFDTLLIPESDLRAIVRAMPETTRGGYFYINDQKFVEEAKLSGAYRAMVDNTVLSEIFNEPFGDFMKIYKKCPSGQKKIIVDMVVSKKMDGEPIDANILIELGKATGRDLMNIEPLENLMA